MKLKFIYLLAIVLIVFSCKKSSETIQNNELLIGTWKSTNLSIKSYEGNRLVYQTARVDTFITLVFNPDKTFRLKSTSPNAIYPGIWLTGTYSTTGNLLKIKHNISSEFVTDTIKSLSDTSMVLIETEFEPNTDYKDVSKMTFRRIKNL